jgi:hypothetical protein
VLDIFCDGDHTNLKTRIACASFPSEDASVGPDTSDIGSTTRRGIKMGMNSTKQFVIGLTILGATALFVGSGSSVAHVEAPAAQAPASTLPVASENLPIPTPSSLGEQSSEYFSASGEGQFTPSGQLVGGR